MNKSAVLVAASVVCSGALAHPQDGLSPEGLMHYYVKVLNEENLAALQDVYHFPHVKLMAGQLTLIEDRSVPVIDFSSLKASGWKSSKINQVKVLAEGGNAAIVELNFSRINAEGKEYLVQTGYYNLTKNNGYWQIMSIEYVGALAGVKAK